MIPYERLVAERLQAEAAGIALPPRERWVPTRKGHSTSRLLLGAAAVLVLVLSTVAVFGESAQAPVGRALATLRALVRPQAQTVPANWNVFVTEGLLLAIPPDFGPAQPAAQVPILMGPGAPTLLREVRFERGLSILVWKGTVRQLLDEFWLRANQQPYTRRPLRPPLSGEEVLTTSVGQSDPVGARPSGTDQARSLFVQLSPDQIAHVFLGSTTSAAPGTATTISAADRELQDQIATHLRAVSDVDKSIDRAQVEAVVRRVVGQLQNADVPPGDPDPMRIYSGEQWVYNWPNHSQSFAYIVVFPDRATRERDSRQPRAVVQWRSPVTERGVGNLLVLIGSNDANLRYRILADLDELTR